MIFDKQYIKFQDDEARDIFLKKYKLLSLNPKKRKNFLL